MKDKIRKITIRQTKEKEYLQIIYSRPTHIPDMEVDVITQKVGKLGDGEKLCKKAGIEPCYV